MTSRIIYAKHKIHYVDVSNVKPEELEKYIQDFRNKIKNDSAIVTASQIKTEKDPIKILMKKIGYEI